MSSDCITLHACIFLEDWFILVVVKPKQAGRLESKIGLVFGELVNLVFLLIICTNLIFDASIHRNQFGWTWLAIEGERNGLLIASEVSNRFGKWRSFLNSSVATFFPFGDTGMSTSKIKIK